MGVVLQDGGGFPERGDTKREALRAHLAESRRRPMAFFSAHEAGFDRSYRYEERIHSGRDWLLTTIDHELNHRGRITLSLRQMGFTDFPSYRYS